MGPTFATLGFFLPELLALIVAFMMLNGTAARGPARNYGLAGIGMMLACSALGLALSFLQNAMISGGSVGSSAYSVLFALRVLLNLLSLGGLLMVVWGLCTASRAAAVPAEPQADAGTAEAP